MRILVALAHYFAARTAALGAVGLTPRTLAAQCCLVMALLVGYRKRPSWINKAYMMLPGSHRSIRTGSG